MILTEIDYFLKPKKCEKPQKWGAYLVLKAAHGVIFDSSEEVAGGHLQLFFGGHLEMAVFLLKKSSKRI